MSDYQQLKVAVQDLLEELRISPACLETMANGYSPDYPGANVNKNREWKNPYCKVQLSMVVAQKLIGAGVIHEPEREAVIRPRRRELLHEVSDALERVHKCSCSLEQCTAQPILNDLQYVQETLGKLEDVLAEERSKK